MLKNKNQNSYNVFKKKKKRNSDYIIQTKIFLEFSRADERSEGEKRNSSKKK